MRNLDSSTIDQIYYFHSQGCSNREIGRSLKLHHKTVQGYLTRKGLVSNRQAPRSPKYINDTLVQCSKCDIITEQHNFLLCRPGGQYEYRLSYCNQCRKKQLLNNMNSDKFKVLRDIYLRCKQRSKKFNIHFNMSYEYLKSIYEKQNGNCFYSDNEMDLIRGLGSNWKTLTIDKIIPELGYTEGNIVLCTKKYNTVKSNLTLEEVRKHMPYWYMKLQITEWVTVVTMKGHK